MIEHRSASDADEAEAFKKVVEETASAEAILAVHNAQNQAAKMTSISLNGSVGKLEEPTPQLPHYLESSQLHKVHNASFDN